MANDVKLLPCPFCGGHPVASDRTIWCPNRDCWGPNVENYANMDDAIEAWNRRAIPSTVSGETGWRGANYAAETRRLIEKALTDAQKVIGGPEGETILGYTLPSGLWLMLQASVRNLLETLPPSPTNPAETQAVEVGE